MFLKFGSHYNLPIFLALRFRNWSFTIKNYNVIIIGSGPAGLFAAIWLENLGLDKIAIIDRHSYPSGGLLNDGKLNFDCRIGFDLNELQIDEDKARQLMNEIKKIFVGFPRCKQVTFIDKNEKIEAIKNISDEHGVQFIAPEQWHWGTDNGKAVVNYLRGYLKKTEFFLETEVSSIEKQDDKGFRLICNRSHVYKTPKQALETFASSLQGIIPSASRDCSTNQFRSAALSELEFHNKKRISYNTRFILAAPGRSGAYWFRDVANELNINHNFGPIDVGIRLELNRKFYDSITDFVYDPKFIFTTSRHGDKVRTFCTNPGGRVRVENYGDFKLVNGDALFRRKTKNTNFALINTVALTKPLSDTTEFGQRIAKQFLLLGGGKPLVQRVGDFREGRRSSVETFNSASRHFDVCSATYKAVPGDIALGMPARIIDNLWESLKSLDKIVPGILHPSTLIYAPEIKFFDTHFPTNRDLETNVEGIFVAGDGTGKSRGIVGAGISGIIAAQGIAKKYFNSGKTKS